jgi:hypothetical protein
MAKHLNKRRNNIVCIIDTQNNNKKKRRVYETYEKSIVDEFSVSCC